MLCESCLLGISVFLVLLTLSSASSEYWEYAVIGAGPAGLQMGYYLQKAGRQYVIMERNNVSGIPYIDNHLIQCVILPLHGSKPTWIPAYYQVVDPRDRISFNLMWF